MRDHVVQCAAGSTPSRNPSAIASPAAAMCTPARNWLMIFTFEPTPCSCESRYTFVAIASSTSLQSGVGVFGAGRHHRHLPGRRFRGSAGDGRVEHLQYRASPRRDGQGDGDVGRDGRARDDDAARSSSHSQRRRSSPKRTVSVCAALMTSVMTTSHAAPTSAGLAHAMPPSVSEGGERFRVADRTRGSRIRARTSERATPRPIAPRPMMPTFFNRSMLLQTDRCRGERLCGFAPCGALILIFVSDLSFSFGRERLTAGRVATRRE